MANEKSRNTFLMRVELPPPVTDLTEAEKARLEELNQSLKKRLAIIEEAGRLTADDFAVRINAIG